jgi:MOSC domain-containing protein YiiM
MELVGLFISPGHNYFGHHGQPAGVHPVLEVERLECLAGRGVRGDRFFDYKENYKGQITFFAEEVYLALCEEFQVWDRSPAVLRRNAITRGAELNELVGVTFEVQGVQFIGTEECRPCHWMDQAFCPGADAALKGRGGLRARILTDGALRVSVREPAEWIDVAATAATRAQAVPFP